jgi:tRNA pseudouridine55 synthase
MDGVLVIDKEPGPTSHDVVSSVRRLLKEKKVGHTGTLDPAATGVLPLVLGKATKVARYLTGNDKVYEATLRLGANTDTLDREGQVVRERPVEVTEAQVRAAAESFRGPIDQLPPMYSAKKIDGKRLYELARQGMEVEREPKRVTIHSLDVTRVELPDVDVRVRCTAGTYLRVLAEDIGEKLGCGAYLYALRRTDSGAFSLADAITLEQLADNPALARERLVPMARALDTLPRIVVPRTVGQLVASGHQLNVADLRTLDLPPFAKDEAIALGLDGGQLIAIARTLIGSDELSTSRRDRRALKTERVIAAVCGERAQATARAWSQA